MSVSPAELERAMRQCEEITRRRARNFFYGLKLTPEPRRSAMYAVYAWMRQADDLVDQGGLGDGERLRRIDHLRARTEALFRGESPEDGDRGDPVWIAMSDTVERYRLSVQPFRDMIEGQLEDLAGRTYQTFDDLRGFCYRVASTVGLVCIEIWGHEGGRARELAIDRGIAFQLTNILRDVREDLDRGRVYLPADELHAAGLTPDELRRWADPERCRRFVLEQTARVESYYERSAPLEQMITPSCMPTLWAMTRIYHGLLEKISAHPERIVSERRIRLSSLRKASIALRARRLAAGTRELEAPAAAARPHST